MWQSSMVSSKSSQRDKESILLGGPKPVLCDALTRSVKVVKGGGECKLQLTWPKISMHDSASLRSKREIKSLPSLSARISIKVGTALAS